MAADSPGFGLLGGVPMRTWPNLQKPILLELQQFQSALGISPMAPPAALEVVKRAYETSYPPHWSEEHDMASGGLYFYNCMKDEASWEHPLTATFREILDIVSGLVAEQLDPDELAAKVESTLLDAQKCAVEELKDWVGPVPDATGAYYYNKRTDESEWEDPRERWEYDIQVRYDLLVGFLVAEERRGDSHALASGARGHGPRHKSDSFTPTLTSLATSMVSVASTLFDAMPAPEVASAADELCWARPRREPKPEGSLALPPRVGSSGPPVFVAASQNHLPTFGAEPAAGGGLQEVRCVKTGAIITPSRPPPPPPPGAPPPPGKQGGMPPPPPGGR